MRSLSGVAVVSVLTKPYPCPGQCIYCPTEKGLPKSYLSGEPAVERAKRANFDPYLQTKNRLESLKIQGHPTDKIELRIIGGSFTAYPRKYQKWFVAKCFQAANDFSSISIKGLTSTAPGKKAKPRKLKTKKNLNLEKEQKRNEKAKHRIVGISIETRPDLIDPVRDYHRSAKAQREQISNGVGKKEILNLRELGVTMVELGVQTIYNDILKKCQRGHSVEETIKATKLLKDAGFKVMYQIMPNLPGSTPQRDFECLKTIFEDSRFKPDWLKIYPCVVCRNTKLYQMWKQGRYRSYSDKELIELLVKIKQVLPYWVRVARLFRDIPVQKIESGSKLSNLRQIVQKEMKRRGGVCHCIRCREVRRNYNPKEKIYLFREDYEASGGKEIFLSFENRKRTKLYSLLRLRINEDISPQIIPILKNAALIRELHTYGFLLPIKDKENSASIVSPQHKGLGKRLIKEAEKIAKKEFGRKRIAVISGVGVRDYFRKLNYRLKETYMVKRI